MYDKGENMRRFLINISTVTDDPQLIIETDSDDYKVIISDFVCLNYGDTLDYESIEITNAISIIL
jgi:hypothetical protein